MQQLYETVCREQEWLEAGSPPPSEPPRCEIGDEELRQIFGTGFCFF